MYDGIKGKLVALTIVHTAQLLCKLLLFTVTQNVQLSVSFELLTPSVSSDKSNSSVCFVHCRIVVSSFHCRTEYIDACTTHVSQPDAHTRRSELVFCARFVHRNETSM